MPGFHEHCKLQQSPERGNHLVAMDALKPGTCILDREVPLGYIPAFDRRHVLCDICCATLKPDSCVPCAEGCGARFCSVECGESSIHLSECALEASGLAEDRWTDKKLVLRYRSAPLHRASRLLSIKNPHT